MKKKILIFTILALLIPVSFSSCDDERWEDELVGGYWCEYTGNYIMLYGNGRGYMEDDYARNSFSWWAGRHTITFAFDGGPTEVWDYSFTHNGIYFGDDYYLYVGYDYYLKQKAAKKQATQKVEEKK